MRVTIEHREVASGVLNNHKDCYLDCTVDFSEEERAIVKARDLYDNGFEIRAATPLPTQTRLFSTGIIRAVGRFTLVAGIGYMIYSSFIHPATEPLGGLLFVVGLGLEIYGRLRARKEDKRVETSEQNITIGQLLNNPKFTVHDWNPAAAEGIEQDVRERLVGLKNLIRNSAQIQAKQTFEL